MKYQTFSVVLGVVITISCIFAQDPSQIPIEDGTINPDLITDVQINIYFEKWRSQRKRCYDSETELIYRRQVFAQNYRKIIKHNSDKTQTYTLGLNDFADIDQAEFENKYLSPHMKNYKIPKSNQKDEDIKNLLRNVEGYDCGLKNNTSVFNLKKRVLACPQTFDWRPHVTPVKTAYLGAAYAFTTVAQVEGTYYMLYGQMKNFYSEKQIIYCCSQSYGCNGLQGGYPMNAASYVRDHGLLDSFYYNSCIIGQNTVTNGFKFQFLTYVEDTPLTMQEAIYYVPISVTVDARNWQFYARGVFNNCGSSQVNHSGILIGYILGYHYIFKNCWGTQWGDKGYITLKHGNTCGVETNAFLGT